MELSIVTYNIHRAIGNDRKYNLSRIIEICKELNPDFIALQEVDHSVPRSRHEDMAKIISCELGMEYILGLNVKLKQGAYGNATFSRHPILFSENVDLTWTIKKARGCLISKVAHPAGEIFLCNFHLGLAGMERVRQVRKILHSIHDRIDRPILALGDTNDHQHRLDQILLRGGLRETGEKEKSLRTFPSYAPIWRLDRIYYSRHFHLKEQMVIRSRQTRIASDHLPVYAKLTYRKI